MLFLCLFPAEKNYTAQQMLTEEDVLVEVIFSPKLGSRTRISF